MIPKIIHYCWFGKSEKPALIKKCLKTWEIMSGYKIIEWNETNCDFTENKYLENAYKNKRWAFVSDYIRLKVLYEYGGIYLDTDVELVKKFSDDILQNKVFISFMFNCNLSTAIIGAEPNNGIIKKLLELYNDKQVNDSPNNDMFTQYFLNNYEEFRLNNKYQNIRNEIVVYPKEFFECPTFNKNMGYSIHHFTGSWRAKKHILKRIVIGICPNYLYHKAIRFRAIKKSPFYDIYVKHNKI